MVSFDYISMGGQVVANNALTWYLTEQLDCPFGMIMGDCWCRTALGLPVGTPDQPTMVDAPWYDPALPDLSSRFYGLWVFDVQGLSDTNRSVQVVEGVDDGAWMGRSRRTPREMRVEGMLIAQGKDALDYGNAWLSSVLDGDRCGQHQEACGVTDVEWLTDCPPARGSDPGFTDWLPVATNAFTNPRLVTVGDTAEVRRNSFRNPLSHGTPASNGVVSPWIAYTQDGATGTFAVEEEYQTITATSFLTSGTRRHGVRSDVAAGATDGQVVTTSVEFAPVDLPATVRARIFVDMLAPGNILVGHGDLALSGSISGRYSVPTTVVQDPDEPPATIARIYVWLEADGEYTGDPVTISVTKTMVESVTDGPYFDGDTSPDPDLTASWTGTANASPSILSGTVPAGVTATNCVAIQSAAGGMRVMNVTEGATITFDTTVTDGTLLYTVTDQDGNSVDERVSFTGTPTIMPPPGVETWYDKVAIFGGEYFGDYFDADTPGDSLTQYVLNADGTTTMQTRETTEVPWDDERYAEEVDPYYRYLHDVVCTSGPLQKRRSSRGEWEMMDVEFTLTAGRPWIYTRTRYPELPVTPSTVVEDIVHNLVPYTSAEIAGEDTVIIATNYSTNPSVEVNATGWNTGLGGGAAGAGSAVGSRVTGEVSTNGTASYRAVFTATAAGTSGELSVWQDVDISARPAGALVSANISVTPIVFSGTADITEVVVQAVWSDGTTEISRTDMPSIPAAGGASTLVTMTVPDGATVVRVLAKTQLASWDASAVVRSYNDSLVVSVP